MSPFVLLYVLTSYRVLTWPLSLSQLGLYCSAQAKGDDRATEPCRCIFNPLKPLKGSLHLPSLVLSANILNSSKIVCVNFLCHSGLIRNRSPDQRCKELKKGQKTEENEGVQKERVLKLGTTDQGKSGECQRRPCKCSPHRCVSSESYGAHGCWILVETKIVWVCYSL